MKTMLAALILAVAGSRAGAAVAQLRSVAGTLAPQLESAAAPSASPETLGLSGENISTALQGGQPAAFASAVEAAPAAAAPAPVSALEPATAAARRPASAIERALPRKPEARKSRAGLIAETVLILALLAGSVASYFQLYHAFTEIGGKAFDGPRVEEPFTGPR